MARMLINSSIMPVLILKNVPAEGPGTIEESLRGGRIPYTIIDLEKEAIPDTKGFSSLVMMGGPMSVNEEHGYPYITEEMELVREFISAGKRVFGVCLGAQIIAKALGARVYVGPQKEIGWFDIELTEEGLRDPLMKKLAFHPKARELSRTFEVFQWHGETFDIPEGAIRLAMSEIYPNQAFRYGEHAYAFQFHIEVKKEMVYKWLMDEPVDLMEIRKKTEAIYDDYLARAMSFYAQFFAADA